MADALLLEAVQTLRASSAAIPNASEMAALIDDSKAAEARGYYDPTEDERLRETYSRYLGVRVAIWQMIHSLRPLFRTPKSATESLSENERQAFGVAFCGAELLVRTGEYLIDLARGRDIVWKKLDEAELRYGIRRKNFTRLYRGLTSARKMNWFYSARDYFDAHREDILASLQTDNLAPVITLLKGLNLPSASRGDHLARYARFVKFSLRRRRKSGGHKIMFSVFEATGSDIADLKIPLVKQPLAPKRVTADIIENLIPNLKPGDVFITRHDDAMSNLFLPGFWPHGALYIGTEAQRRALGVAECSDGIRDDGPNIHFLESKKDGVLLRPASETLQVDAFTVLRPRLSDADLKAALTRGLSHAGKLYDFVFDFSVANRLVCTEVIYRAYHGIGDIDFKLSEKAGRKCLSAEDFLNQALTDNGFELVYVYGVGGNTLLEGPSARKTLAMSFESTFT